MESVFGKILTSPGGFLTAKVIGWEITRVSRQCIWATELLSPKIFWRRVRVE